MCARVRALRAHRRLGSLSSCACEPRRSRGTQKKFPPTPVLDERRFIPHILSIGLFFCQRDASASPSPSRLRLVSHPYHSQSESQFQTRSYSDSVTFRPTHTDTQQVSPPSFPPAFKLTLALRLAHVQTHSHSDPLILKPTHTQTYTDAVTLRRTHTQTHSHSGSLTLRLATHSHSDSQILRMSRARRWLQLGAARGYFTGPFAPRWW